MSNAQLLGGDSHSYRRDGALMDGAARAQLDNHNRQQDPAYRVIGSEKAT